MKIVCLDRRMISCSRILAYYARGLGFDLQIVITFVYANIICLFSYNVNVLTEKKDISMFMPLSASHSLC
jgi:hypothetical protein